MSSSLYSVLVLSLWVALIATLLNTLVAVPLAWTCSRTSQATFFRRVLMTFVLIPLALPPVVSGYLLLRVFGSVPGLAFSFWAAVLAAAFVSLPLYFLAAYGAFYGADRRLERVLTLYGVKKVRAWITVSLYQALPGLLAGAVITFGRALGEFGATAVFAGNIPDETQTLSLAIYSTLQHPDGMRAVGPYVGCSVLMSVLAVVFYQHMLVRRPR